MTKLLRMAEEIDRDLRAIRHTLRRPVESEFARGRLTGPQRSVMQAVVHSSGISQKDLSRQVGLAHSTVSGIVHRLEQRGLLRRETGGSDGRVTKIVASKIVRDFMRDTLPRLEIHPLIEALRRAAPADRQTIVEGLQILRRVIEA